MVQRLSGTSLSSTSRVVIVGITTTTIKVETGRDVEGVHVDGEEEVAAAVIVVVAVELAWD